MFLSQEKEKEMSAVYEAKCPKCGEMIEIDGISEPGDPVVCEECDTDLEIVKMDPPRLRVVRLDEEEEQLNEEEGLDDVEDLKGLAGYDDDEL